MVDHPICCVRWPTKAAIGATSKLSLLVSCAALFFFLGPVVSGWFPSLVRIIGVHGLKGLEGIWPEIFLIHNAIRADHECLAPRNPTFCRRGHERESANHRSPDDEIGFTAGRSRALLLQHLEIITVIRLRALCVTLLKSFSDFFSHWTAPSAVRILPGEAILLARCANNALRILIHLRIIMLLLRIFLLRIIKPATDRDCVEFIRANTAV